MPSYELIRRGNDIGGIGITNTGMYQRDLIDTALDCSWGFYYGGFRQNSAVPEGLGIRQCGQMDNPDENDLVNGRHFELRYKLRDPGSNGSEEQRRVRAES
jgi:hypothetical protein